MNRHTLILILCFAMYSPGIRAMAQSHPDRVVQDGVPKGKLTTGVFEDSKIFPGTRRDFSVYRLKRGKSLTILP